MQAPILDDREIQMLRAFVAHHKRDALLVELMFDLGLRPMEIAGLQREWFRKDELRIPLGYSKRKSGRTLPITAKHHAMLNALMGNRWGTVFLNRYDRPFSPAGMSEYVRKLMARAGLQGSAYSARRGLASKLVDNNVHMLVIQRVLGHSNVATTMSYCAVSPNAIRSALFG